MADKDTLDLQLRQLGNELAAVKKQAENHSGKLEKSAVHEANCAANFRHVDDQIKRVDEGFKAEVAVRQENDRQHTDRLTRLETSLMEKDKNNTSRRDLITKFLPWGVSIAAGIFSIFVTDKLNKQEAWIAEHERVIEHRDTVQCLNTQALQVAHNNTNPDKKLPLIECGEGAGI